MPTGGLGQGICKVGKSNGKRAVKTAPGGLARARSTSAPLGILASYRRTLYLPGHNVRLRGLGYVPTRVGGFRGGTPSRRGFNRPRQTKHERKP